MSRYAPTPEVMAIGQINISGNVTPANWWKYIRLPSGRPDATAIALLSEIVYWYRPTEVRDEHTGALLGYRKRFQGDKLQRSYQAFAEQFGFGKRETADALKRLRDAGFITLDLRTVEMLDGVKCSNILFVGINPQAIAVITTPSSVSPESNSNNAISDTAITLKRNTPDVITEQGIRRMLIQIQRLLQRLQRRLKTLLMHPLTRLRQRVLPDRNIHRNLNRPGRNIPNVLVAIPSQQPSKPGKPVSGRE